MICVIICVFNALQLCSLHIFGILIPDHCRFEERINEKKINEKWMLQWLSESARAKGVKVRSPNQKRKRSRIIFLTFELTYEWLMHRISNQMLYWDSFFIFQAVKQQTIYYINLNLNLDLWNSYLFNLNNVMINSLYPLSCFSFKIILSICCYSLSLILFSSPFQYSKIIYLHGLFYYITLSMVFSFIFIVDGRIGMLELNLCGTIAWIKLNYRFGRHSIFNRLY